MRKPTDSMIDHHSAPMPMRIQSPPTVAAGQYLRMPGFILRAAMRSAGNLASEAAASPDEASDLTFIKISYRLSHRPLSAGTAQIL